MGNNLCFSDDADKVSVSSHHEVPSLCADALEVKKKLLLLWMMMMMMLVSRILLVLVVVE